MKHTYFVIASILIVNIVFFADGAYALPTSWTKPSWSDADKEHSNDLWTKNYYKDENHNGAWDFGEPWSDFQQESDWVLADDMSCWIASGANMLSYHGLGSAESIYNEILGYASYNSIFEWDNGGFQHWAVAEYLTNHNLSHKYSLRWYSDGYYDTPGHLGWLIDPFEFAKQELYVSETLGIALDDPAHAITFWGWDDNKARFADSDQAEGALHNLTSTSGGENWFLDYDDNGVFDERVRYISVLSHIPEPSTILLFLVGMLSVVLTARKRVLTR